MVTFWSTQFPHFLKNILLANSNLCVTLLPMIIINEYIDSNDRSPYAKWFNRLNAAAAARVVTAVVRMEQGNLSNVKGIGGGVLECRIDFGPGYRVYFGRDGDRILILFGGDTKKRQKKDIEDAKALWKEYKNRKRQKT